MICCIVDPCTLICIYYLQRLAKELQILNKMGVSSFIKRISDGTNGQKYKYSLAIALTLSDACQLYFYQQIGDYYLINN